MADQWKGLCDEMMAKGKCASVALAGEDNQFFIAVNDAKTEIDAASFDLWWKDNHNETVETDTGAQDVAVDEVASFANMIAYKAGDAKPTEGFWLGGQKFMYNMSDELEGLTCSQFAQTTGDVKQTGVFVIPVPSAKVTVAVRYAVPLEFVVGNAKAAAVDFAVSIRDA